MRPAPPPLPGQVTGGQRAAHRRPVEQSLETRGPRAAPGLPRWGQPPTRWTALCCRRLQQRRQTVPPCRTAARAAWLTTRLRTRPGPRGQGLLGPARGRCLWQSYGPKAGCPFLLRRFTRRAGRQCSLAPVRGRPQPPPPLQSPPRAAVPALEGQTREPACCRESGASERPPCQRNVTRSPRGRVVAGRTGLDLVAIRRRERRSASRPVLQPLPKYRGGGTACRRGECEGIGCCATGRQPRFVAASPHIANTHRARRTSGPRQAAR
mmetsp:Transcript_23932/g.90447  ORF Transcript_23932/g.90447 Transcript_23932/m.90447 type:complete len:266 (-) Transcript_23932:2013-2810(-)